MVISVRGGKAQSCAGAMRKAHILVMQGSGWPLAALAPQISITIHRIPAYPIPTAVWPELGDSQELVGLQ